VPSAALKCNERAGRVSRTENLLLGVGLEAVPERDLLLLSAHLEAGLILVRRLRSAYEWRVISDVAHIRNSNARAWAYLVERSEDWVGFGIFFR
jgi:hypothetical protein